MEKKRYTILKNKITTSLIIKYMYKSYILKSLKFNRNIKKKNRLLWNFLNINKKGSISTFKNVCLYSGYKRSIILEFNSSRYVLNRLAKLGLVQNFKP